MPKITRRSKQPSLRITMPSRPWSGNSCCDWPVCYGGCAARRLWKLVCSKFRPTIWVGSTSSAKFPQALERLSMPCLGGLTQAVSTQIQHRTAARAKQPPSGNPSKRRSIPPPSSRVAFCDSPICPTTRSTASADMKEPFGAKPARSFLLLMPWVAANHGIEGAVSVSAVGKNCRSTIPRNVNFRPRRMTN